MSGLRATKRFWSLRKVAVTASVAVFLTLAGSGVSYAMWTASASVSGSVHTGTVTVGVTQTAGAPFGNEALSSTGSFTVTNTSSAVGTYKVEVSASTAGLKAFTVWSPGSTSCASPAASAATVVGPITGSLAPGDTASYCLTTTVNDRSTLETSTGDFSFNTKVEATLTVGNWTGKATAKTSHTSANIYPQATLDPSVAQLFRSLDRPGLCAGASAAVAVTPADCPVTDIQVWQAQLRGPNNYQLVAADSGLCAQAKNDGSGLEQVTCDGTSAQQFTLEPVVAATP